MEADGSVTVKSFHRSIVELQREIGSGSFGKVYKGMLKDTKKQIAVKVFYQEFVGLLPNVDSKLRESAYDELAKVAILDHENIVRLLGMVQDEIPWLVFEYMRDGNLLEYVMRKKDQVKERTLIRFCRDICNGMAFLHRNNFLHKDLAARNILLDGKTAKIADLGLCSFLTEENKGSYALGGKLFPYRHAASECIVECIYTYESDVWSFGVLLFEVFTQGAVPYGPENKQPEVRRFIADGMNPTNFLAPNCSEEVTHLMNRIFIQKREDRPAFNELLQYFEACLGSRGVRVTSSKRDASPFRAMPMQNHQHHRQRAQGSTGSSDRLSISPPTFNVLHLGTPPRSTQFYSNPDLTNGNGHHQRNGKLLGLSPLSSVAERRNSETPGLKSPDGIIIPKNLLAFNDSHEDRPRRTASFSNLPKPEAFQKHNVQQNLLKDFVPNRFGGNKK